jgi:hypothetical protein
MKLLLIHGAPASGKYTVGKAVLDLVPGRMMPNHAAIAAVRETFEFGHPAFWHAVFAARYALVAAAVNMDEPLLVATMCYADPDDLKIVEKLEEVMGEGSEILPVFLDCPMQELERRVGDAGRVAQGKISTVGMLRAYLDGPPMAPAPRPNCLTVDTSATAPAEAAARIVEHFALRDLPDSPWRSLEARHRAKAADAERDYLAQP